MAAYILIAHQGDTTTLGPEGRCPSFFLEYSPAESGKPTADSHVTHCLTVSLSHSLTIPQVMLFPIHFRGIYTEYSYFHDFKFSKSMAGVIVEEADRKAIFLYNGPIISF